MNLTDGTLVTHTQVTRDMGVAISLAMLACWQLWLAQTTLSESIRKDLWQSDSPRLPEPAGQGREVLVYKG